MPKVFLIALLAFASMSAVAGEPLYGPKGVSAEAVRQGRIGSCYFHSAVAALAQTDAALLKRIITANADGSWTVKFQDGATENAYLADIQFARDSEYDLSDGLWVSVLFRAYAQRVLRASLTNAVRKSSAFPFLKPYALDALGSGDLLVLAYDRALRSVVDQAGQIPPQRMEQALRDEMRRVSLPETAQSAVLEVVQSSGALPAIARDIEQNGELFGAYRAVGQGGLPQRALEALTGRKTETLRAPLRDHETARFLARAGAQPLVAAAGIESLEQLIARGVLTPADSSWYTCCHAYTVLSFDATGQNVRLRNPWGHVPDPDGVGLIPLAKFVQVFQFLTATE